MIANTVFLLRKWREEGKQMLAEGANAAMLDIDLGTYLRLLLLILLAAAFVRV